MKKLLYKGHNTIKITIRVCIHTYVHTYIYLLCKLSVFPYFILIFSVTALFQCSNNNQLITSCRLACIRITLTLKI
jgi:hypothetical protein